MIKEILDVRTGKREQVGGSGGSTELKLVATGTLNRDSNRFELDTSLDTSLEDKLYLINYINDEVGQRNNIIARLYSTYLVICSNQEGNNDIFSLYLGENFVSIFSFSSVSESEPILSKFDILEIYELPFTLGGAE